MNTLTIELTNQKAYKLLKELEELHLIKVINDSTKISTLRNQIKSPMNTESIDAQLNHLREEWHRDI
ncbi:MULTISPECIES: hypothetical protein [unclassified Pedobacter]|jgi:hypothetical protein|uniref:hypothetical protein n=1 Tax=Pedobacter TaxID=84567 RepID=UPI000B4BF8E4|nr:MULTISPECIES: hypothetical protein [unclassified Pedobacter]MCX2433232.1 hypothetical protein [Pedobacter sp. GR22-10]MCX2583023.1 hypothetical protein [Pedobacter sp. MR22-3]OWK69698.1 hypothetical protein CBW18_15245 [Pedobacter sp. AJM]